MAHSPGFSKGPQTPSSWGSPSTVRPQAYVDGSVAMEQSASSSSISSSVVSFLTSSSSVSAQTSAYLPTTPRRSAQIFDPIFNKDDHDDSQLFEGSSPDMGEVPASKRPLNISSLISPPEAEKLDHFSGPEYVGGRHNDHAAIAKLAGTGATNSDNQPKASEGSQMSPPITPDANVDKSGLAVALSTQDPILFPDAVSPLQSQPLFPDSEESIISDHSANRKQTMFRETSPPRAEDYQVVLRFQSNFMETFSSDPRSWLRQQKAQLQADSRAAAERIRRLQSQCLPRSTTFTSPTQRISVHRPQKQQAVPQLAQGVFSSHGYVALTRPVHDSSNRITKRTNRSPVASRGSGSTRIAPQLNGTPRQQSSNLDSARIPGSSPEPRVRTSAPNREDKDFMSLEDYCPPLSTLPTRTNKLKVDWKGTPLNLEHDPLVAKLHPDEVELAASLRLDCATYLTSKRRIFIRRLECARIRKEFRKTDAQQACKIDVNKASKLWTAYEKVGWLKLEHIQQFL